ncbi:ABC transporter permease [Acidobacteriota bacterium]
MIRLIAKKELREIIGSAKFVFSFGVCAVLILLAFVMGAKNYQVGVARYEAAKAENLRKMEGLDDWVRVNSHRIFLPPRPLETLVTGVSNDVGRTIEMRGRGELIAYDSRYNDNPLFAIFRYLDLEFIFTVVLSLFAILFGYDAINGEKERGTLRLTFANAVPRDKYILGKLAGSFAALVFPLLLPILIGCLLLSLFGVNLTGEEWLKLAAVIAVGLLYFSVFLTLSIFVSTLTRRSSSAFLFLLVIWILAVQIIPRSAVLLAGRAVDVPTFDELAYQKSRQQAQLWKESMDKMSEFKPSQSEDPEKIMQEFNGFMDDQAKEREKVMKALTDRLNEDRRNRQVRQERLTFGLARISPSASFSLAAANLSGTSIDMKQHFVDEATAYQETFGKFMLEKTGMNLGGRVIYFKMKRGDGEEEEEKLIDPRELPEFFFRPEPVAAVMKRAVVDVGLLILYNIAFFVGAFVAFMRYDVR